MSKPLIFSLCHEPDCDEDILSLRQVGLNAETLPMLTMQRDEDSLRAALKALADQPDAQLITTSKQAARMLISASAAIHDRPVWCVGAGTAALLTQAGFTKVTAGKGDAHSLMHRIIAAHGPVQQSADKQDRHPVYLWLSGADIAVDIGAGLADLSCPVSRYIIYKMTVNLPKRSALAAACQAGRKIAVIAMSARTITLFSKWLAREQLDAYRSEITLILQSPAQLALAETQGLRGISAPLPSREDILACAIGWAKDQGA